jgi:hypothetical protein
LSAPGFLKGTEMNKQQPKTVLLKCPPGVTSTNYEGETYTASGPVIEVPAQAERMLCDHHGFLKLTPDQATNLKNKAQQKTPGNPAETPAAKALREDQEARDTALRTARTGG